MAKPNKFGKSLANIRQASQDNRFQSPQNTKIATKQIVRVVASHNHKMCLDFSEDEQLESREQVIVSFRTSESNRKALKQFALDQDLPLAEFIKRAIETYLSQ